MTTTSPDVPVLARPRVQGILLLVLVFLVGSLVGLTAARRFGPGHGAWGGPGRGMGRGDHGGPRGALGALRSLDLTPEQCSQVQAIIDKRHPQMDAIMRETFPRMRAISDSLRQEVREVLTPAQREQLDKRMPAGGPFGPRDGGRGPGAGADSGGARGPSGPGGEPGPPGERRPFKVCENR